MALEKKGTVSPMMFFVFTLVALLITLGMFIYSAWPYVRYGPFSPCWANAVSVTDTLSAHEILRDPQTVILGDCISAIYLINNDTLKKNSQKTGIDSYEQLDCKPGGSSYVVTVPIVDEGDYSWNIFKWPVEAWKDMKTKFLETLGVSSYCNIASRERSFKNPQILKGPGKYCIDIANDEDSYGKGIFVVYFCEDTCEECGPNPYNPGIFEGEPKEGNYWHEANIVI